MTWITYAAISAGAAALTAVLAKIGVEGVPSNLATAIRTVVVLVFAWAIASAGRNRALGTLSRRSLVFLCSRRWQPGSVARLLSRASNGAGIERGADRQASCPDAHLRVFLEKR
jgi:hypothetical protein